jgi:hypothetical protein
MSASKRISDLTRTSRHVRKVLKTDGGAQCCSCGAARRAMPDLPQSIGGQLNLAIDSAIFFAKIAADGQPLDPAIFPKATNCATL